MESYFNAFHTKRHMRHTKRHMRHSKKLMTVHVELTNPDLSSETGFEDLATIG